MKTSKPLLLSILFSALLGNAFSQSFYRERISRDNILTVGVGPSFAYLDNGGQYRAMNFAIKPAFSLALTKKMSPMVELRATTGVQWISSGGNPSTTIRDRWFFENASFTAKGPAYYFDLIPSFYLVPFSNHMHRSKVNLYGGAGLGVMHVVTQQTKSFNPEENPTKQNITTGYVPVRAGLSLRVGPYSDIAGEGTMLWTFTDNLDGNVGFNRFGDHLFQAQIVFRRYFIPKSYGE
ncbi:hypothetical protein DFQ04_0034 [Algoriphagus boseongensis]|uniref:Outer membrane protein with beta-barrel domain n=1 Tax=Algoriphagus boseongensis TaxID=1442587 RepID=A0A4R6T6L3_9BACT|nr:hypothetical protein [Algoriphagus boseongensis]TDQ18236.1 hypothetical protein DFQ04_0034 [Algoriphagus boseongensis]